MANKSLQDMAYAAVNNDIRTPKMSVRSFNVTKKKTGPTDPSDPTTGPQFNTDEEEEETTPRGSRLNKGMVMGRAKGGR